MDTNGSLGFHDLWVVPLEVESFGSYMLPSAAKIYYQVKQLVSSDPDLGFQ